MNYLEALRQKKAEGVIPVIPDIKCFSPKEGDLMRGRNPVQYAVSMEAAGAPVLSVVTEEKEFHGSMKLMREICEAVRIPVLRKDFIEDAADLRETKEAGGSAILLMYSCLGKEKLEELYQEALKIGLCPFVETHSREELLWAAELGAGLIGINNRDILLLERDDGDVSHAASLLQFAPADAFLVVESGLESGMDVRRAVKAGADAALVGTAILNAPDPESMLHAMMRPCDLKICGIMREEDAVLCAESHADVLGFVTEYPVSVPWNLRREETKRLLDALKGTGEAGVKSCVVTGGSVEKVIALARELRPDYVQLHYSETLAELRVIAAELHALGIGVVRSIPSDPQRRMEMFGSADESDIFEKIREAGGDAGLLDSRDAGNAAVGGESILANKAVRPEADLMLVIGGGITGENAWEACERFHPDMIDVMTGSETAPGRKDRALIKSLTDALAKGRHNRTEREED